MLSRIASYLLVVVIAAGASGLVPHKASASGTSHRAKKTSTKKSKDRKKTKKASKAKAKTPTKKKASSKAHAKSSSTKPSKKTTTTHAKAHSKKPATHKKTPSTQPSTAPSTPAKHHHGGSSGGGSVSGVSVLFCPNGNADTMENDIIAKLNAASSTIDVAMYTFDSGPLADACVAAAGRGVTVRVLLDSQQAKQSLSKDATLKSGGCSVDYIKVTGGAMGTKFHHKFCIIDQKTLLTGSYNWTESADQENYENYVTLSDGAIVGAFITEFNSLWTSKTGGVGSTGDVVFAPSGSAKAIESRIVQEIQAAKSEILIAMYEFTSADVAQAVADAASRGVAVYMVTDYAEASVNKSSLTTCSNAGVNEESAHMASTGFATAEFHDKYCVIDRAVVITGSFNWNIQQDEKGYENIIVLHDASLANTYVANFDAIYGDTKLIK